MFVCSIFPGSSVLCSDFFWHNWRPFTSFVFKLEYSKYKASVAAGELAPKVTGFCYFGMDWGEAMNSVAYFIYLFVFFVLTDVMQDSKTSPQATLWQFTSSCENTNSRCNPNFSVGYYTDFTPSTFLDKLVCFEYIFLKMYTSLSFGSSFKVYGLLFISWEAQKVNHYHLVLF